MYKLFLKVHDTKFLEETDMNFSTWTVDTVFETLKLNQQILVKKSTTKKDKTVK